MGTSMDSTSFHELIAKVRGAAAQLAEAEQKVAAFKAELAQQEHGNRLNAGSALLRAMKPIPKRVNSGWLPATDKPSATRGSCDQGAHRSGRTSIADRLAWRCGMREPQESPAK
jgi:hypothetical protein